MSQDQIELLRPVLAEWAKGNFWTAAELMAPDITFQGCAAGQHRCPRARGGRSTDPRSPAHWRDYRIEAEELEDLGEDSVLVVGRQRGTGKLSGAQVDFPIFMVWKFRGNGVIGVYLEGNESRALEAAGLSE